MARKVDTHKLRMDMYDLGTMLEAALDAVRYEEWARFREEFEEIKRICPEIVAEGTRVLEQV